MLFVRRFLVRISCPQLLPPSPCVKCKENNKSPCYRAIFISLNPLPPSCLVLIADTNTLPFACHLWVLHQLTGAVPSRVLRGWVRQLFTFSIILAGPGAPSTLKDLNK